MRKVCPVLVCILSWNACYYFGHDTSIFHNVGDSILYTITSKLLKWTHTIQHWPPFFYLLIFSISLLQFLSRNTELFQVENTIFYWIYVFADFSLSTWNSFILLLQLAHSFSFLRLDQGSHLRKFSWLPIWIRKHKGIPLLRCMFLFWVSMILCHSLITIHFNYILKFMFPCLLHKNMTDEAA